MGIFSSVGAGAGTLIGGPVGTAIGGGLGGVVDSLFGGDGGSGNALGIQRQKTDAEKEEINRGYNVGQKFLRPYESQDNQASALYSKLLMNPKGSFNKYVETPAYQFQKQQGIDAAQNSAAAHGGLVSGAALKGLETFGSGLASQGYNDFLTRLQGLQGQGQSLAIDNANRVRDRSGTIAGLTQQYANMAEGNAKNQATTQNTTMQGGGDAIQSMIPSISGMFNQGGGMNFGQIAGANFGGAGSGGGAISSYQLPQGGLSNYRAVAV